MKLYCNRCGIGWDTEEKNLCPVCGGKLEEDTRKDLVSLDLGVSLQTFVKGLSTARREVHAYATAQENLLQERTQAKPVVKRRQEELQKADNHYLGSLYGLKTISPWTPRERELDISVVHTNSTTYLRDAYDKVSKLFESVIDSLLDKKKLSKAQNTHYFLVNSRHTLERLEYLEEQGMVGKCSIPCGETGVYVLAVTNAKSGLDHEALKEHLANIGATPSSYRAYKYLNHDTKLDKAEPKTDEQLNNQLALCLLLANGSFLKLKQIAASRMPLWSIYDTCVRLVEGLRKELRIYSNKRFTQGVLVADALRSLAEIVGILSISAKFPARAARYYDLLLDEVFLILAAVAPYKGSSLTHHPLVTAEEEILRRRTPLLERMEQMGGSSRLWRLVYPAWSGMDALVTALEAAGKASGNLVQLMGTGDQGNYFEVPIVLAAQARVAKDPTKAWILYATLLPSTPLVEPPSVSEIVGAVASRVVALGQNKPKGIKAVSLIIDATLQLASKQGNNSALDRLLAQLRVLVAQGKLQIFVSRSYQKYQQLGSGKVMGGATTLLYSYEHGDKQSADYLSDLQTSDNLERDELQFFTHLLRYAADSELDMIEESGKNARFVGEQLLPYGSMSQGVEGLPFLMKADAVEKWLKYLDALQLDSFGMVTSTFLGIVGLGLRVTIGQEPRERLIEKFFAAGHLMPDDPTVLRVAGQLESLLMDKQNVKLTEALPFTIADKGAGKNYVPPLNALLSAYKEKSPRLVQKATDLDRVVASYLTFVLSATKGGYNNNTPTNTTLIRQFSPADQLLSLRLFRGFFRRGLLLRVSPEARAVLSGGWLELLYNLKNAISKKALDEFLDEYGLKSDETIPFPAKTRIFLEVFELAQGETMKSKLEDLALKDRLGCEIVEFGRYAPNYFVEKLSGTPGAGTELTAVVKKYIAQRPKKLVSDLGKL